MQCELAPGEPLLDISRQRQESLGFQLILEDSAVVGRKRRDPFHVVMNHEGYASIVLK